MVRWWPLSALWRCAGQNNVKEGVGMAVFRFILYDIVDAVRKYSVLAMMVTFHATCYYYYYYYIKLSFK